MASSSSLSSFDHNKKYQYDVFLSFSGEDTRRSFVDHLNVALQDHGIHTFKDDERLHKGKEIKDELLKSIDDSKFCIIVFSKKYASSSWCLDELVKIMECHKTTHQTAFPVFYDVEPTEVRKQSGSVGEALAKHTKKVFVGKTLTRNVIRKKLARHTNKKMGKWRKALKDAANLCGWELKNTANGHEAKVIKLVVERVSLELRSINMGVDENLIGMEKRMQDLDPYLEIGLDDVRIIGIKGMGGAGKTTLARAIFDKISSNFEGKSFLEDVRENSKASLSGLKKLQEQLLTDVLKDKFITVSSAYEGRKLMQMRLRGKKILVVLDDVDHKDQLEVLAHASWFKPGSRIIITTRDEQVLIAHGVKWIHDVSLLSTKEADSLFRMHAFQENIQTQEFESQLLEVVRYAAGLPLTIKVLGSFLCGKNKSEWIDAIARLKTIPLEETLKKLELSLEDDYKEIFLDVACFHINREKENAIRMLERCGFHARNGLRVLEQKSLITYDRSYGLYKREHIEMHDHILEMGKNIIRRDRPYEPNKHSRLWVQEEIEEVLANDLGTKATRCIYLETTPEIVLEGLRNMKKLRCLVVNINKSYDFSYDNHMKIDEARQYFPNSLQYLCWYYYPHWCLPKTFEADNLVTLEMYHSKILQLWEGGKIMKKLKFLILNATKLRSLDLELMPNLEKLDLTSCRDLVEINVHGGCLKSLVYLSLCGCPSLKSVLFIEQLKSLEVLQIGGLNLREFPYSIITRQYNNSLVELHISDEDIEEVPSSIGNLHMLVSLHLAGYEIKSLPGSICSLQRLRTLTLRLPSIKKLPDDLGQLQRLEKLDLTCTHITHLPDSICMLKHLKTLFLQCCFLLKKLPDDIGQLISLEMLHLPKCFYIREIPSSICMLGRLKFLNLSNCPRLEKLPENIGQLESLEALHLINCDSIREIPNSICKLKHLKRLDLDYCTKLEKLPDELGELECLQELGLGGTHIHHLPPSISLLNGLEILGFTPNEPLESSNES